MKSKHIQVLLAAAVCSVVVQGKETKLDPQYGEPTQFVKKEWGGLKDEFIPAHLL